MRTTKSILILLLVVSVALSAQKKSRQNTEKYSGKVAIFFGPSQTEYDSLAKDDNSGIDEVLSDLYFYADKIEPYLKEYKIKSAMTSVQNIQVNYSGKFQKYNRAKLEQIVGVILSDGVREPKIFYGIMTDEDMKMVVKEYFKLN